MLHGCTQTPADFAAGTQMDALADQKQFIVVYPQQTSTYNASFSSPASTTNGQVPGGHAYTVYTWNNNNGQEIQEYWKVYNMGHAWSGGSSSGSFTDPQGPNASLAIYTFFMSHPA